MISYQEHIRIINTIMESYEQRINTLRDEIKELKEQLDGSIATGYIIDALSKTYSLDDLKEYWPEEECNDMD